MKKTTLFVFLIAFLGFSCNKEEDPMEQLEKMQFALLQDKEIISIPQAMYTSGISYVSEAANLIAQANSLRNAYLGFYSIPYGATKSSEPINASNARLSASAQYLVYKWSYGGFGIAYQLHATSSDYVLEVFIKMQDEPWEQLLFTSQAKDGKSGETKFFGLDGSGQLAWTYSWQLVGDLFKINMVGLLGNKIYAEVSTKTGAGKMEYFLQNTLNYEVTWTAQGSGTWAYYGGSTQSGGTWN